MIPRISRMTREQLHKIINANKDWLREFEGWGDIRLNKYVREELRRSEQALKYLEGK